MNGICIYIEQGLPKRSQDVLKLLLSAGWPIGGAEGGGDKMENNGAQNTWDIQMNSLYRRQSYLLES